MPKVEAPDQAKMPKARCWEKWHKMPKGPDPSETVPRPYECGLFVDLLLRAVGKESDAAIESARSELRVERVECDIAHDSV